MRFRQKPFLRKCLDNKIYALLFVYTTKIQEVGIIPELRQPPAEMPLQLSVDNLRRPGRPVSDDLLLTVVGMKSIPRQDPLFFSCENYCGGIPKHPTFDQVPVDCLFKMLRRIILLKPWIERAMYIDQ